VGVQREAARHWCSKLRCAGRVRRWAQL